MPTFFVVVKYLKKSAIQIYHILGWKRCHLNNKQPIVTLPMRRVHLQGRGIVSHSYTVL